MGRLYNENGEKMNVVQACNELVGKMSEDQMKAMGKITEQYVNMGWSDQKSVAHAILDTYSKIGSVAENDQRVRKIMDWLMTKYQKSTATPTAEEDAGYRMIIESIIESRKE